MPGNRARNCRRVSFGLCGWFGRLRVFDERGGVLFCVGESRVLHGRTGRIHMIFIIRVHASRTDLRPSLLALRAMVLLQSKLQSIGTA